MTYDEIINTEAYKIYRHKPTYIKRVYKLNKYKDYYKIYSMNISLVIYNHGSLIKKLDKNLEDTYYFKYDTKDEYYLLAEFPSSCDLCGFIVSSKEYEFNQTDINSTKKNDILKIQNDILSNKKANNDLFDSDIKIIDQNYFECLTSTKKYHIKKNETKPYIFLYTRKDSKISINNTIQYDDHFYFIEKEEGAYLTIYVNYSKVCFDLIYNEKNYFEIKPGKTEMEFNIFDDREYKFNLSEMDPEKGQYISLRDKKYNLHFYNYYIDDIEYHYDTASKYIYFNSKEEAEIKIPVSLQLGGQIGKLEIYFDIKGEDEEKEEEIKPKYRTLNIIASCFAFACFAAVVIVFFYLLYETALTGSEKLIDLNLIDLPIKKTCQKLKSVYLFKRN